MKISIGLALVLAITAIVILFSPEPPGVDDEYVVVTSRGPLAPPFELQSLSGEMTSLSEMSGKVIIANFWATWCAPCRVEMPSLQALQDNFPESAVQVVAISVDDSPVQALDYIEQNDYRFLTLWDRQKIVAQRYGVTVYPYSFVIDKAGHVVDKIAGVTDWASDEKLRFINHLAAAPDN